MKFLFRRLAALNGEQKANSSAIAIVVTAMLFLQLESAPRPAGADTFRVASAKAKPVVIAIRNPAPVTVDEQLTPELLAQKTLQRKIELLNKGVAFLEKVPDYTAQFSRLEVVNGELLEEQMTSMKVAHKPFNVYMKWENFDTGREVIYGEGLNNGNLLVHPGGWKARLPPLSMEPDSSLAKAESRHPITQIGLSNLAKTIINSHRRDIEQNAIANCDQAENQRIGGRDCLCFVTEFRDAKSSPEYLKSIVMIDAEWNVPLFIKNFAWPPDAVTAVGEELDTATIIEQYSYTDVKLRASLTAADFDRTNEDYNFKRQ